MVGRKQNRNISYEMPTLGFHVPEGSDLLNKINEKAKAHDGKTSQYVRRLVEDDIRGGASLNNPSPLEELARVFNPTQTGQFEGRCPNQKRVIFQFLEALAEAIKRPDFRPEERFAIYNSTDQLFELFKAQPNSRRFLRILGEVTDETFDQLVAEENSIYPKPMVPEMPVIRSLKNKPKTAAHTPTPIPLKPKPTALG